MRSPVTRSTSPRTCPAPGPTCRLREAIAAPVQAAPRRDPAGAAGPGDPRGLPGPGPFTGAALVAGEGVVARRLGLVPEVQHTSGSGDTFATVLWRVFVLPETAADATTSRRPPRPTPS